MITPTMRKTAKMLAKRILNAPPMTEEDMSRLGGGQEYLDFHKEMAAQGFSKEEAQKKYIEKMKPRWDKSMAMFEKARDESMEKGMSELNATNKHIDILRNF